MKKLKKFIKETDNELKKHVAEWLLEKAVDYDNNIKSVLADLLLSGCVSGIVSYLIYYDETNEFYDRYENEIWGLLEEQSEEFGHKHSLEMIAGFNGAGNVRSDAQFKNLLAWYAFEETARNLSYEIGIEI